MDAIAYGVFALLMAVLPWEEHTQPYPFHRELGRARSAERQVALLGATQNAVTLTCEDAAAPFYQGRLGDGTLIFSLTCHDGARQIWVARDNRTAALDCATLPAERACYRMLDPTRKG